MASVVAIATTAASAKAALAGVVLIGKAFRNRAIVRSITPPAIHAGTVVRTMSDRVTGPRRDESQKAAGARRNTPATARDAATPLAPNGSPTTTAITQSTVSTIAA